MFTPGNTRAHYFTSYIFSYLKQSIRYIFSSVEVENIWAALQVLPSGLKCQTTQRMGATSLCASCGEATPPSVRLWGLPPTAPRWEIVFGRSRMWSTLNNSICQVDFRITRLYILHRSFRLSWRNRSILFLFLVVPCFTTSKYARRVYIYMRALWIGPESMPSFSSKFYCILFSVYKQFPFVLTSLLLAAFHAI